MSNSQLLTASLNGITYVNVTDLIIYLSDSRDKAEGLSSDELITRLIERLHKLKDKTRELEIDRDRRRDRDDE